MIALLKWVVMTIYNILPDSPFSQMVENLELNQDFLQYLNWFLPLDIAGNMILAWLDCMLLYLLFLMVKKIIFNLIIKKISSMFNIFELIAGK